MGEPFGAPSFVKEENVKHVKTTVQEAVFIIEITQTELSQIVKSLGRDCGGCSYELWKSLREVLEEGL